MSSDSYLVASPIMYEHPFSHSPAWYAHNKLRKITTLSLRLITGHQPKLLDIFNWQNIVVNFHQLYRILNINSSQSLENYIYTKLPNFVTLPEEKAIFNFTNIWENPIQYPILKCPIIVTMHIKAWARIWIVSKPNHSIDWFLICLLGNPSISLFLQLLLWFP